MATKTELTEALEAARKAAQAGPTLTFIERLVEGIGAKASVGAVFGDPIERDGLTIIPVAKVRWGFGGGAGLMPVAPSTGSDGTGNVAGVPQELGSGGGGAVTADPVGWLEIGPEGAEFRPIEAPRPSAGFILASGATAALVLRSIARIVRR